MPVRLNNPATDHFDKVADLGIVLRLFPGPPHGNMLGYYTELMTHQRESAICGIILI